MCYCPGNDPEKCMCESLSSYSRQCALKGIYLEWRSENLCSKFYYLSIGLVVLRDPSLFPPMSKTLVCVIILLIPTISRR